MTYKDEPTKPEDVRYELDMDYFHNDEQLKKYIMASLNQMLTAELMGEAFYGEGNFETVWVEDLVYVYPAKGYFPREEGTLGNFDTGAGITVVLNIERMKHEPQVPEEA